MGGKRLYFSLHSLNMQTVSCFRGHSVYFFLTPHGGPMALWDYVLSCCSSIALSYLRWP